MRSKGQREGYNGDATVGGLVVMVVGDRPGNCFRAEAPQGPPRTFGSVSPSSPEVGT